MSNRNKQSISEMGEFVGIKEIAEFAEVSTGAVINWRKRFTDFPKHVANLSSGPIYKSSQIQNWLGKKGKVTMANVISLINLKGGVGKTTSAVGLAHFLAGVFDKRVLVIDLDPQTNATVMLIGDAQWKERNVSGLTLAALFKDAIYETNNFNLGKTLVNEVSGITSVKGLDLLPSSLDLIDIQDKLIQMPLGKYYAGSPVEIINRAIKPLLNKYDYVIIDCPPNLGLITLNGLRISSGYIIPTIPDNLSTYGIPQIIERVDGFAKSIGENIDPYGILITKFRSATNLHKRTYDLLCSNKEYPKVFNTIFPENTQIAEAGEFDPGLNTLKQRWGYTGQFDRFGAFAKEIIDIFE